MPGDHRPGAEPFDAALVGRLLALVGDGVAGNQRALAAALGIALGATNARLKRCVADGLVAMTPIDGRRYAYALTPKGAAEKARLGQLYFGDALALFRRARGSFDRLFAELCAGGARTVVLCGSDELTEIAILSLLDSPLSAIGVWRHAGRPRALCGLPGVTLEALAEADVAVVAVAHNAAYVTHALRRRLPSERIAIPDILDVRSPSGFALKTG